MLRSIGKQSGESVESVRKKKRKDCGGKDLQKRKVVSLESKSDDFHGDVFRSQSLGLVRKKLNLTEQKHAFANQKKCTATQNNH